MDRPPCTQDAQIFVFEWLGWLIDQFTNALTAKLRKNRNPFWQRKLGMGKQEINVQQQ
jgi:hypothetical protein